MTAYTVSDMASLLKSKANTLDLKVGISGVEPVGHAVIQVPDELKDLCRRYGELKKRYDKDEEAYDFEEALTIVADKSWRGPVAYGPEVTLWRFEVVFGGAGVLAHPDDVDHDWVRRHPRYTEKDYY